MGDNPLSGKVELNTTDFKTHITELNRDIKVIEAEFRAVAAGMGDWDKTSAGLEARIKALNSQIEIQKQKVAALDSEYQKSVSSKGQDARVTEDLRIRLANATGQLNKMTSELKDDQTALAGMGKESKNTSSKTDELKGNEEKAASSSSKFGDVLNGLKNKISGVASAVGGMITKLADMAKKVAVLTAGIAIGIVGMGTALAAGAVAAAVGLGHLILNTATAADDLDELSQKTGVSVEALQELSYIGNQNGIDLDTMTGSLSKLIKSMDAAQKSTSPAGQAFAELGIQVRDSKGNLRDSETVWRETIAALGKIPDETERDALAMQLLGKSAMDLNPLILMGADGMAQMADEAHKMGAVMSTEDVKAMADFNDKLDGLKTGFRGVVSTLASSFMPAANGVLTIVTLIFGAFRDWLSSSFITNGIAAINNVVGLLVDRFKTGFNEDVGILGLVGKFINGLNGMRGISPIFSSIADAVYGLYGGLTNTDSGMTRLQNSGLGRFFIGIGKTISSVILFFKGLINTLFDFTAGGNNAKGIGDILEYIFPNGTASKIMGPLQSIIGIVTSLFGILTGSGGDPTEMVTKLGDSISGLAANFISSFASKPAKLIEIALSIINGLGAGITAAIPALLPAFLAIITGLVTFITTTLPTLIKTGLQIIMQLAMAIMQAIPQLVPVVLQIISTVVQFLIDNLPALIEAAVQMIVAIITGLAAAIPQLMAMAATLIPEIIITLINALPLLIQAALQLIIAIVNGLVIALPILIKYVPDIIQAVFNALILALPMIGQAAVTLVMTLITGIIGMLPTLGESAIKLINVLVQGVKDLLPTILTVGKSIVEGIWQGIQDNAAAFGDNISKFFTGIVDGVKKLLGIHSPSTIFAGMGSNMALGLGAGFSNSFAAIQKQIMGAVGGLGDMSVSMGGSFGGQTQPTPQPIQIIIQGAPSQEMDMRRLARYVAVEIQRSQ